MPPNHILVIDDDPLVARIIAFGLERVGGELVLDYASSGLHGLELARTYPPCLIILDFAMPGMDGLETLRHLRANALTGGTPIVAISGALNLCERGKEMIALSDAYLPKPFDFKELFDVLSRCAQPDADVTTQRPL